MKIAAVIIVYHPDRDLLLADISAIYDSVDVLYLWRNSVIGFDIPEDFLGKTVLCGDESNEFISKPLNTVLSMCREEGYDYLLTMDQDSRYLDFPKMGEYVRGKEYDGNVVIYAPNVNGVVRGDADVHAAETVITSGSLLNVDAAVKLGGFREDYKIYWVDGEFCTWSRANGYRIEILTSIRMEQQFGTQSKGLFGCTAYNYSPSTYYYMFRNMLWMRREYPEGVSMKCILYTTKMYVLGIVFGKEKDMLKKLGRVIKAFADGIFKKYEARISYSRP